MKKAIGGHELSTELGESKGNVDPLAELAGAQKALQSEMLQAEQDPTSTPQSWDVQRLSASSAVETINLMNNVSNNTARPPLNPNATDTNVTASDRAATPSGGPRLMMVAHTKPHLHMVAQTKRPPTLQPTATPKKGSKGHPDHKNKSPAHSGKHQKHDPKLPFIPDGRDASGAPIEQSQDDQLDMPKVKSGLATSFTRMSEMAQKLANEDSQELQHQIPK